MRALLAVIRAACNLLGIDLHRQIRRVLQICCKKLPQCGDHFDLGDVAVKQINLGSSENQRSQ
jgi:hypothetical protein